MGHVLLRDVLEHIGDHEPDVVLWVPEDAHDIAEDTTVVVTSLAGLRLRC